MQGILGTGLSYPTENSVYDDLNSKVRKALSYPNKKVPLPQWTWRRGKVPYEELAHSIIGGTPYIGFILQKVVQVLNFGHTPTVVISSGSMR
jgi:hypothetical protein